jgi:hypothetical protein
MIMKRIILLLIVVIPFYGSAQKQGNIWYFGLGAGLDFNSGVPMNLAGGHTGFDVPNGDNQEGTACISDSSGNLLFYTGGQTIWNRNHLPMPNGSNIMGGVSSTQSSLIVPLPGSDSIFYVFTTDEFQHYSSPNSPKGYRYSVVDMCLENGLGDVIAGRKNILLCDTSTEKLAACQDLSGNGYWIVGHKMFSDRFYAWHLTSGGITDTVTSDIGAIHGWWPATSSWSNGPAQGQMKINASGTKLALAISNFDPPYLEMFDFNNNTGVLSNLCRMVIDSLLHKRIYTIEFSPDETKLYAALVGGYGGNRIYQYNLLAGGGNCDSIYVSQFQIAKLSGGYLSGMQLATSGKIYLINLTATQLGCINYPNLSGAAADFDSLAFTLSASSYGYALPGFIAGFKYHNGVLRCSPEDVGEHEINNDLVIQPNPATNSLTVECLTASEIEILNAEGQVIKILKIKDSHTSIDVSGFSRGIYLIKVITAKGIVVKKFIKE